MCIPTLFGYIAGVVLNLEGIKLGMVSNTLTSALEKQRWVGAMKARGQHGERSVHSESQSSQGYILGPPSQKNKQQKLTTRFPMFI